MRALLSRGKDMKRLSLIVLTLFYVVGVLVGLSDNRYLLGILITISASSIAALGVWVVLRVGLVNIGQAAFCAVGGYVTALLCLKVGLVFWLAAPVAVMAGVALGYVIGKMVLRLRGLYFAMVTLIVGEVVRLSVLSLPSITGGSYGLYGIPRPPGLGARSHLGYFLLFTSLLIVSYLIVSKLVNSRIGLTFKAIRESDSLAESVGINVARYKVLGFLVCSGLGALAGSMVIVFTTSIFPSTWNMFRSVYFLLYCFLGGMSHPMGAVVGAFVLTGLFEILRPLQMYQSLIYAALIVGVVLFFPEGILGFNLGSLRMTRWQRGWTRLSSKVRGAVSTTERKARNSSRDIWR